MSLRDAAARMVTFPGQESLFAGLRRRRVIADSPRIVAEEEAAPDGGSDFGRALPPDG